MHKTTQEAAARLSTLLIQVGDSLTDVLRVVSACVVVGKMSWEAASQVA